MREQERVKLRNQLVSYSGIFQSSRFLLITLSCALNQLTPINNRISSMRPPKTPASPRPPPVTSPVNKRARLPSNQDCLYPWWAESPDVVGRRSWRGERDGAIPDSESATRIAVQPSYLFLFRGFALESPWRKRKLLSSSPVSFLELPSLFKQTNCGAAAGFRRTRY